MYKIPDYDRLYYIAENQGGFFSASQARGLGFSWDRLSKKVKSGKFLRSNQGVYRLAQFPYSRYEDLFIACLRVGPEAVVSHESALSVYGLSDVLPNEIHIIVPRSSSTRRDGIKQHTNRLEKDEITTREGLQITTIARTLADVASSGLAEELVLQAIDEALHLGLVSNEELSLQEERKGGRFKGIYQKYLEGMRK